jgi:hypothetical protein
MSSKRKIQANLLVFTLLFFSGNPLATFLFGKLSTIIGLLLTLKIINSSLNINKLFIKKYKLLLLGILLISMIQYIILPSISFPAIVNLILKILMGGFIISYLQEDFALYFFKVLAFLSSVSLVLFLGINIVGISLPYFLIGPEIKSYIIYGTSYEFHMLKNAGMFWEPGAHAGILTLCLGLNFNHLKYYWFNNKFQLIVIILAVITTQSTTGYIVGFLILLLYFYKPRNFGVSLLILPLIIGIGLYFYNSTDFLKEKIEYQFEKTTEQEVGDFSNTRFGSLIFDWHYINKHPLIGNGFDKKTRYQDHSFLFVGAKGDVIGSGNSFSHYIASMGIFFVLGYFVLLWNATVVNGKLFAFMILTIVFLNLQGEQWFNYPLYLGLPFVIFAKNNSEKAKYKYQTKL